MSDIQSLCCLLSDTAGMSLHHTQELPSGDSFWAGQLLFVFQFIITEVKSSFSILQITEEERNWPVGRERHFSPEFPKVIPWG